MNTSHPHDLSRRALARQRERSPPEAPCPRPLDRRGEVRRSVEITASVPGTGSGSVDGQLTFSATFQNQRSALLLANGRIYVCSGSHDDLNDYHGWVMAFDAATLTRTAAWNTTPNGERGGYLAGRGGAGGRQRGQHLLPDRQRRLRRRQPELRRQLREADRRPRRGQLCSPRRISCYLSVTDLDLGSAGPILIPGTSYVAGGGKEGKVYLLDTANLGGYSPGGDTVVDEFQVTPPARLRPPLRHLAVRRVLLTSTVLPCSGTVPPDRRTTFGRSAII